MLEIRRHLDGFLVAVSSSDRISALAKDPMFERTMEYYKKVGDDVVLCGIEFFYKNPKVFQLKSARKEIYKILNKHDIRTTRGRPGAKNAA